MKKIASIFILSILLMTFSLQAAYAGNGDGNGDGSGGGSGGGQEIPLTVISTSIQNGQINPDDTITLTFNKNVIHADVREHNNSALNLYDSNNNIIPTNVIMADEQINPEAKRDISVKPAEALSPGASYTLVVSKEIQAKNGSYAEADYRVTFSIAGAAEEISTERAEPVPFTAAEQPATSTPASSTMPEQTEPAASTEPEPKQYIADETDNLNIAEPENAQPIDAESNTKPNGNSNTMATVMYVCAGLALCALILVLCLKSKAKSR